MPKKILFCATVDYHFKAFHLPYLKWFKEQGWEVHIAARGELELPYVDQKYNIAIERSPLHKGNLLAYQQLKGIIDDNCYDIIHCHTPMGGVLTRLAARAARKKGTNVIYTAHGFHFCKGAPFLNWLIYYPIEKVLAPSTDCLITINEEDFQLAKKKLKAKQVEHVHGVGVNTERFKPIKEKEKPLLKRSFGYKADDFLLFYAAEFNENKNQQLLIHALALIKEEVPNAKLLLAGEGELLEECKSLAHNLGISDRIRFLGFRNDLEEILPMCDVAVASSIREGLPVNIMESMACGLPVVAVENRGHRELVQERVNGFLVISNEYSSFSLRLLELHKNQELYKRMQQESLNKIKSFSLGTIMFELTQIYSQYMVEEKDESKGKHNRAYI